MTEREIPGRVHFLDGLRGWAALMVVFSHSLQCWLINPDGMISSGNSLLLKFTSNSPLAVAMDGTVAIRLFFVISGFALSYPFLVSKNRVKTLLIMAAFRYFRLAIPIFVSCLLVAGLWNSFSNVDAGKLSSSSWLSSFYLFNPSWTGFLKFVSYDVFFAYDTATTWNAVLWTMNIELLGSFAIFVFLAVVPSRWRIIIALGLAALSVTSVYCCFAIGYLIADGLFLRQTRSNLLGACLLVLAFAVASSNHVIFNMVELHYATIAGLTLAGVALSPGLQRILSSVLSRFMGRISFSLYLVHIPIICSLGSAAYLMIEPHVGFLTAALIVAPVVIASSLIAALIFNLIVEEHLVIAAKRLVSRVVVKILAIANHRRSEGQSDSQILASSNAGPRAFQ